MSSTLGQCGAHITRFGDDYDVRCYGCNRLLDVGGAIAARKPVDAFELAEHLHKTCERTAVRGE